MNTKWILPKNIEDSLPPESEFLDSLSQSVKSIFKSYGFHFIIPPSIEFLDSLNTLEKDHQNNNNYFLTYDNNSNATLAFRSDITVQAARIDSHILSYNKINKLYYEGNILTPYLDDEKLTKNFNAIIDALEKEKSNNTLKGDLVKHAFMTSTMGVSYKVKLGKSI